MTTIQQTASVLTRADKKSDDVTWFRASTPDVDRHGTIIEPRGIDTETFDTNPVFMWGHDAYGGNSAPSLDNVLGRVVEYSKSDEAFDVAVRWATAEENPRAQMAKNMVRGGILNAVSIGFIPREDKITTKAIGGDEVPVYEETELVEVSLVPVPANPNAIALVRSMQAFSPVAGECDDGLHKAFENFKSQSSSSPAEAADIDEESDMQLIQLWIKRMQYERFKRRLRQ